MTDPLRHDPGFAGVADGLEPSKRELREVEVRLADETDRAAAEIVSGCNPDRPIRFPIGGGAGYASSATEYAVARYDFRLLRTETRESKDGAPTDFDAQAARSEEIEDFPQGRMGNAVGLFRINRDGYGREVWQLVSDTRAQIYEGNGHSLWVPGDSIGQPCYLPSYGARGEEGAITMVFPDVAVRMAFELESKAVVQAFRRALEALTTVVQATVAHVDADLNGP